MLTLALAGAARAEPFNLITFNSYKLENRPDIVFPGKRLHITPYPLSKRAASKWDDDFCWRACTGQSGWRFQDCARVAGPETCRFSFDADNRYCQRTCRSRGGPLLPLD